RRHTSSDRDWSSDVCSSDLVTTEPSPESPNTLAPFAVVELSMFFLYPPSMPMSEELLYVTSRNTTLMSTWGRGWSRLLITSLIRSEERRVGKEGRSRSAQDD